MFFSLFILTRIILLAKCRVDTSTHLVKPLQSKNILFFNVILSFSFHYCVIDSDLDPLQAPLWTVRVRTTENPQCLLGKKSAIKMES